MGIKYISLNIYLLYTLEKYIFQKRENGHIQLNFWLNHSKVLGTGYLNVLRDWLIAAVI